MTKMVMQKDRVKDSGVIQIEANSGAVMGTRRGAVVMGIRCSGAFATEIDLDGWIDDEDELECTANISKFGALWSTIRRSSAHHHLRHPQPAHEEGGN